jgi:hypothetical protein
MVKLSIIFNIVTIILVILLFINKNKKEEKENGEVKIPVMTISASKLFNSILSDNNALATNRAEQPLDTTYGDLGDFTTFDSVDYELERHINVYNIEDWVDTTDTSLTVKSTMDYVSSTA